MGEIEDLHLKHLWDACVCGGQCAETVREIDSIWRIQTEERGLKIKLWDIQLKHESMKYTIKIMK